MSQQTLSERGRVGLPDKTDHLHRAVIRRVTLQRFFPEVLAQKRPLNHYFVFLLMQNQ